MFRTASALVLALAPGTATAQATIPVEDVPFAAAGDLSARLDPARIADSDLYALVPPAKMTPALLARARVIDYSGDRIGDVRGVVMDGDAVAGIVLSVGGGLGIGDKSVAVPIDAVLVGRSAELGDSRLIVGLTRAELEALPAWDG